MRNTWRQYILIFPEVLNTTTCMIIMNSPKLVSHYTPSDLGLTQSVYDPTFSAIVRHSPPWLEIGRSQDVPFSYTQSHFSEWPSCKSIISTDDSLIFMFKEWTTQFVPWIFSCQRGVFLRFRRKLTYSVVPIHFLTFFEKCRFKYLYLQIAHNSLDE